MTSYPKAPYGWKLIFTKETGWKTPALQTAAKGSVAIEDKVYPVAEYPGWMMLLQRSIVDPKMWLLLVSYAPDGTTMSPDTLAIFARSSEEQPKMPVSFAWGTTKWLLIGAGVVVLVIAATVIWKRSKRAKRRVRPRARIERSNDVTSLPDIPSGSPA